MHIVRELFRDEYILFTLSRSDEDKASRNEKGNATPKSFSEHLLTFAIFCPKARVASMSCPSSFRAEAFVSRTVRCMTGVFIFRRVT